MNTSIQTQVPCEPSFLFFFFFFMSEKKNNNGKGKYILIFFFFPILNQIDNKLDDTVNDELSKTI